MMNKNIRNRKPLWKIFSEMSRGDREALAVLKELAHTARAIDPDCPLGPYGVIESIQRYGFTPKEIVKLYRLCDSNVLMMNAVDYAIYWEKYGILNMEDLKSSMKNGFRDLSVRKILHDVRQHHGNFGQYYTCR